MAKWLVTPAARSCCASYAAARLILSPGCGVGEVPYWKLATAGIVALV
jgi:hypothetical protein